MSDELLVQEGRIQVPYLWSAGIAGTRFLKEIREHGRFLASPCPKCGKRYLPPRRVCGACFAETGEWVEAGPLGSLLSFTRAVHLPESPLFGLILLDGADTALLHRLGDAEPPALAIGTRLEPVFGSLEEGHVLGIRHFRPWT